MYFKLSNFSGIAPGVDARRLGEQFGQTAENIDFESGALVPTTINANETTLSNSTRRSVFRYEASGGTNYWLQWNDDVDVVKGPVPNDSYNRLYWTGEDYPRVGTSTSMIASSVYPDASFRLGIPAPAAAPTTAVSGTADSTQTPYDVSYVFTFVSLIGEEGPPSPASTVIELTDAQDVTITMGATPSGNYNFGTGAKRRIYRSNTGSTNTQFQFVGEVAMSATTFTDTKDGDELGEILPSETWIGPPDDDSATYPSGPMLGLIPVANGIMAGFTGNRLCLSEPFLPHAWPVAYRITLEDDIVAISATGNGIVALTEGDAYFVTGADPSAMTAIKLDIQQACVNKHSAVNMGGYTLYAGPDGLVAVSGNEARVVTQGLISAKQWNDDFSPSSIRAFRYENTYVAFYSDGGVHKGWVYDPRAQEAALSTLTSTAETRGGYEKSDDGEVYIIQGSSLLKYRGGTTKKTMTFKSKTFVTPSPVSFGWISVDAEAYPVDVKVIADGTTIADYTISKAGNTYTQATTTPSSISDVDLQEPVMRLPATQGKEWEIEVSGSTTVNEVCIAQSIDEVKAL
ncbi:hypothetical protein [Limnobacter sp.]|uniref:hypothetical protein n=1 Tax=Limnobacter sp. TaxID=2003368 RepID=UPI0025B88FC9|nr:hypothetical protein [Limnobacter sp.]